MSKTVSIKILKTQVLFALVCFKFSICQYHNPRCSNRLENALELILRKNEMKSKSRTFIDLSPYSIYHSLYDSKNDDGSENYDSVLNQNRNNLHENFSYMENGELRQLSISKVEVADLKVRLPNNMRWVQVDKCHFNPNNRTLDTRLLFPDLTISGKVILHPAGGRCNMILRLRRAGIEFRTVPIASSFDESLRSGGASVRTDSHFAEPGFLSVFAHGCQGPYGLKVRQNSKRRQFDTSQYDANNMKWLRYNNGKKIQNKFNNFDNQEDLIEFNDDFLAKDDSSHYEEGKTINNLLGPYNDYNEEIRHHRKYHKYNTNNVPQNPNRWHNAERPTNSDEVNEILMRELEKLFSMGVRGLLTTYMQKALQPAIKETLMQNMGYTISYG